MRTGYWISGLGHGALIFWLLFGGFFLPEPAPEFEMTDVGFISEADFQALQDQANATPAAPVESPAPVPRPEPDPIPEPVPEPTPAPVIEPEVEPTPEPPAPEPNPVSPGPEQPVETPQVAEPAETVIPEANEIIAPTPVVEPEPEVEIAPEVTEQLVETPEPAEIIEEVTPTEATTVENGGDEIVPEQVEAPSYAPVTSRVPQLRPARPVPTPEPAQETVQTTQSTETADPLADVINNAVTVANETPAGPSGPPLTSGERDGLRRQVHNCWNTGAISSAAERVIIKVHFSLNREGKVAGDVVLASWENGDRATANIAFSAARRAILRCGARGYDMPAEKFDHWRDIEANFDASGMQR